MQRTNHDSFTAALVAMVLLSIILIATLGISITIVRSIHVEPLFIGGGSGLHAYIALPGGYQIGGGITANDLQLTGGLGLALPGAWAVGEGLIVDWPTQAVVRMSDHQLLWYW